MRNILLLITIVLLIICLGLSFLLNGNINKISVLSNELSIANDSLRKLKICNNDDYRFNTIRVHVDPEGAFVTQGEDFNFYVSLNAVNICIDNDTNKKAKIVYKYKVELNNNIEYYDTINVDWIDEKITIKPRKLGVDSLVGEYLFPYKNKYLSFPFTINYNVLDKKTSKLIKSKINE
jgi:hypothetical protein